MNVILKPLLINNILDSKDTNMFTQRYYKFLVVNKMECKLIKRFLQLMIV